jgi:hypothetical protein
MSRARVLGYGDARRRPASPQSPWMSLRSCDATYLVGDLQVPSAGWASPPCCPTCGAIGQIRRSLIPVGCIDESKTAAEPEPKGTVQRMWSAHRGELRGGPVTASAAYSHTVRAAARDAVRVFLAHGVDSPDAATAVRHLVARLGEQYGPQFLQDVTDKLFVELAEATAASGTAETRDFTDPT